MKSFEAEGAGTGPNGRCVIHAHDAGFLAEVYPTPLVMISLKHVFSVMSVAIPLADVKKLHKWLGKWIAKQERKA